MKRMLVGFDGGLGGHDAVALARALAPSGADIVVATIYPQAPLLAAAGLDRGLQDNLRARGGAILDRARALLEDVPGVEFRLAMATSPAAGLHRLALELEPDALVVGTSHQGPLGRIAPGSVTEQTIHGAPCPIAVAPRDYAGHGHELRRMGIAFDGSAEGFNALERGGELARSLAAAPVVIEVVDQTWPLVGAYGTADVIGDLRETAEMHLREAQHALAGIDGVTVQTREGFPARELAEATHNLDLLVLGPRGYGPFKRLLLGSVSAHVVRNAECPILLYPRATEAHDDSSARAEETTTTATG
ncbi:MAG: UspA domain protein [Conexibacter sp.]|nr:UspA domain protein [Conexibacter sp.]